MTRITGTFLNSDGAPLVNATVTCERVPRVPRGQSGGLAVPTPKIAQTGAAGDIDITLLPGKYVGEVTTADGKFPFEMFVAEVAAQDIMDCVEAASVPLTAASTAASQAAALLSQAARDAALATVSAFSGRAALVTWAATATVPIGLVMRAGGCAYRYIGSGTAISDLPGWIPEGEISEDHFNGNLVAMQAYLDGLPNTENGVVRGTVSHTVPMTSDSIRSRSLSGTTAMSNLNDPGSILRYTGTGKSVSITGATNANPAVLSATAHGFTSGERLWAVDVTGGTWGNVLNDGPWYATAVTANSFALLNDAGTALDGTALGAFATGTIRNEAAMAGYLFTSSFAQKVSGLVLRNRNAVESIVTINAENNDSGNTDDFSGSLTQFDGVQFAPDTTDVTLAKVRIANHKFATFKNSWWLQGPSSSPAMIIGDDRSQSLATLLAGVAMHTEIDTGFFFSNLLLRNAQLTSIRNTQFDGTSAPVRLGYAGNGVASGVDIDNSSWTNDGGANGSGLAAIDQAPADATSPTLPFTSGWSLRNALVRDWPIAFRMGAGFTAVQAGIFAGRVAGNIGIVIGEDAVAENIGHENNFMQMIGAGNLGIDDRRARSVAVTSISLTNPVVVGIASGHYFRNGDRVRFDSAVGGTTQVANKEFIAQGVNAGQTTFQLYTVDDYGATSVAVDGTAFTPWTSGGTVKRPYGWHRKNFGGRDYSMGHGALVVDAQADQFTTLSTGNNYPVTLNNVPTVGGWYDIRYSSTLVMGAITGRVSFAVLLAGAVLEDTQSSFLWQGPSSAETHHHWSGRVRVPAQSNVNGSQWRLQINAPGAIQARGRSSGSLGSTRLQVCKVS